ncbi:hypothetical protein [Phaeocystidibacter luteus]|uniref:Uncharacterized protein n=1 Tax=Phaeocystidibacter luteus TaxID=911197 RepID=A0A6N6RLZ7_9FLAO|nr:hypothetical protein [Phaeocystidibacter luteus]KAB2814585.1 hypothetical protein F8C67_02260 [Phaeocystidibacter luteus]
MTEQKALEVLAEHFQHFRSRSRNKWAVERLSNAINTLIDAAETHATTIQLNDLLTVQMRRQNELWIRRIEAFALTYGITTTEINSLGFLNWDEAFIKVYIQDFMNQQTTDLEIREDGTYLVTYIAPPYRFGLLVHSTSHVPTERRKKIEEIRLP